MTRHNATSFSVAEETLSAVTGKFLSYILSISVVYLSNCIRGTYLSSINGIRKKCIYLISKLTVKLTEAAIAQN